MDWQKTIDTAQKYKQIYSHLETSDFSGNLRKEAAKRMGMSVSQADRYKDFNKLIPEIQNLMRDYGVGMSNLLKISSHMHSEQREIYDIILDARKDEFSLSREFINHIVDEYRDGNISWDMLKESCNNYKKSSPQTPQSKHPKQDFDYSTTFQNTGIEFEHHFADLLNKLGFIHIETTQHSYDGGKDICAQKDGIRYIFQCKNTKKSIGIKALQEIWFAKKETDHVAVVVTTGKFSPTTLESAQKRGIVCWNGKDLHLMLMKAARKK